MRGITIQNLYLRAEIQAQGAELRRFGSVSGLDFLWSGDPAIWPRTSPILFPVVGRCRQDRLNHGGRDYPMARHGFARDRAFELVWATRESCTYALKDDAETRAIYPFPFDLRITHSLEDWTLRVTADVLNRGSEPLPFSLGAHPAFRWPLFPGVPREAHRIVFEQPEYAPVRRLDSDGLLAPEGQPTPVRGQILNLHDGLFEADALIMDQIASRAIRFEAPGCPALQVEWAGYRELGLWTKPGAGFLCIEPWHGTASRADESCSFRERPGVLLLEPEQRRSFRWAVTVVGQ